MQNFFYVYILIDAATEAHHYAGFTQDLSERLAKHNAEKYRTLQGSSRDVFKPLWHLTQRKKQLPLKII